MNMDKLEIYRVLVLSTAHVTFEDNEKLTELALEDPADQDYSVLDTGYGWLVQVLQQFTSEQKQAYREMGMSPEFVKLLDFAAQNDIQWLHFDRDGNAYEEFPQFDW